MTDLNTVTSLLNGAMGKFGSILIALLVLLFMITIHEFGHYIVAKIFNFKVNEFSIGMGPAIFKKKKKNGEYFSIRLLPLGGYCAFEGEDDDATDPRAFNNKKPWQRILVLIAGATMNFVAAILIFMISIGCYGQMCVQSFEIAHPTEQTLQNEDVILSLNNKDIYLSTDLISALKGKKEGDKVSARVQRKDPVSNTKKIEEIEIVLKCDPTSKSLQDFSNVLKSLDVAGLSGIGATENVDPQKFLKGDIILRVSDKEPVFFDTPSDERYNCFLPAGNGSTMEYFIDKDVYMSEKRAYTPQDFYDYAKTLTPEDTLYVYISRGDKRMVLNFSMEGFDKIDNSKGEDLERFFDAKIAFAGYRMYTENVRFGFFESIGRGFVYAFKNVGSTFQAIGQLFTGKLGLDALGGPITTITMTSQVVSMGFHYVLEIMGFIGVSLAVFNLLPIPALDGARVVFVIIEWIRKKPVKREIEGKIHMIGLLLLIAFAVMIDLVKCF